MFGEVVLTAHKDNFIDSLGLAILLGMIRCFSQASNIEKGAHRGEEFLHELSTIIGEDQRWSAVRDEPMIREDLLQCAWLLSRRLGYLEFAWNVGR